MNHLPIFKSKRRPLTRALVSIAIGVSGVGASLSASALTCDGSLYVSQGAGSPVSSMALYISPPAVPVAFASPGSSTSLYNATGYNPTNNQLYGLVNNVLYQVAGDGPSPGAATSLGPVANLPDVAYNSGTFSSTGVYYVKPFGNTNVIYAIDVLASPLTATAINLSTSFQTSDIGWVGSMLYSTADNGQLYSMNVTPGSTLGQTLPIGSPDATGGVLGAQFAGTNGLFGVANDGSGFFKISLATGQRTFLSAAPSSGSNDGASCPNAAVAGVAPAQADLAVTKTDNSANFTPGTNSVYTIVVTNNGPDDVDGVTVSDSLPAGITSASWTCAASSGGACAASGTGAINDTTVSLLDGGTATYTLTLVVPSSYTGATLANTVTVTPPADVQDPNPGNNTATDTSRSTTAVVTPTAVPVDSPWMLLALATLLGGAVRLRKGKA
ncbi:DUF11 domain-containing protein [Ottowia thiooxydans]|uniref:Repeat protein (TIGR01451 family) n=1 Tax=Ottowia thiooxydans TaxID=219182 RepID=A0ABV2QAS3_9BURK